MREFSVSSVQFLARVGPSFPVLAGLTDTWRLFYTLYSHRVSLQLKGSLYHYIHRVSSQCGLSHALEGMTNNCKLSHTQWLHGISLQCVLPFSHKTGVTNEAFPTYLTPMEFSSLVNMVQKAQEANENISTFRTLKRYFTIKTLNIFFYLLSKHPAI